MPIDSYLNQQVTRKPFTGLDVTGKPTVGATATIEARFQSSDERIVGPDQQEYIVDAALYVKPSQAMTLDDLIAYEGISYRVVRIDVKRNLAGRIDHKKCLLSRTKAV